MTHSPADLVPLLCKECGSALEGDDEAAVYLCSVCGMAYESAAGELAGFRPLTAAITTQLATSGPPQYLAFWRLAVQVSGPRDGAWWRLSRACAPAPVHLYVPAFTLTRAVLQRLGTGLTEMQPRLELTPGLVSGKTGRSSLRDASVRALPGSPGVALMGPDFETLSPVVIGRSDCRTLAHFVFLALESHEAPNLHSVDYQLETAGEELLFVPALWDPRHVHDSNWRFLLHEYDGKVA